MKRRGISIVTVVACLALSAARPAEASLGVFIDWLQEMSGPGGYRGFGVEVPLDCRGTLVPAMTGGDAVVAPGGVVSVDHTRERLVKLDFPNCLSSAREMDGYIDQNRLRLRTALSFSYMSTPKNNQQYIGPAPKVSLYTVMPTFDVGVHRALDLGVGAGLMLVRAQEIEARKLVLEPVRVTVRPFLVRRSINSFDVLRRLSGVELRLSAVSLTSLTADDFGAIPGTFETGPELLWRAALTVDVLRIVRPFRQRPNSAPPVF